MSGSHAMCVHILEKTTMDYLIDKFEQLQRFYGKKFLILEFYGPKPTWGMPG
jgi:hypothetical protein